MKEKKLLITTSIFVTLIFLVGISYAYIRYTTRQSGINTLQSDCVRVEMQELTNAINLVDVYPVIDTIGERTKPFQFKLTNTCGVGVNYNLNLEVMETESRIASKNIAVKVDDLPKSILNTNTVAEPTYNESDYRGVEAFTLKTGELKPSASVTHEIRLWLDESAGNDAQNGKFYSKVVIQSNQNQIVGVPISDVNIGDYIAYTPSSTSYTISTTLTGYTSDQTINPNELNLWRVIRKNSDGTVDVVSEYSSSANVYFIGRTGYEKFVGSLNTIAKQYETNGITVGSRHMGYNGQTATVTTSTATTKPWTTLTPNPTSSNETISPIITNGDSRERAGGGDYGYLTDWELVRSAVGNLIAYKPNTTTIVYYWLSGRSFGFRSDGSFYYSYRLGGHSNGILSGYATFEYQGQWKQDNRAFGLRPIVILDSALAVTENIREDGSKLWTINKKYGT